MHFPSTIDKERHPLSEPLTQSLAYFDFFLVPRLNGEHGAVMQRQLCIDVVRQPEHQESVAHEAGE